MTESDFAAYMELLLNGDHRGCGRIVQDLLARDVAILEIYQQLFQRALYLVGELWAQSQISVGTEHLATSITESMLTFIYPKLFASPRTGRRAVVACVGSEFHQMGARMVADTLELCGWDAYFLGANTPIEGLLDSLEKKQPDVLGLSVTINSNLVLFQETVEKTRARFPRLEILAGGQALPHNGARISRDSCLHYLGTLDDLVAWTCHQ